MAVVSTSSLDSLGTTNGGNSLEGTNLGSYNDQFVKARYSPHLEIYNPCSCVSYLKHRWNLPQEIYLGNAKELKVTSTEPVVGGAVLTKEGEGHAGFIISFDEETITFDESNYVSCQESRRTLRRDDPLIRGYMTKPG